MGHYNPNNPNGQRNAITRIGLLAFRSKNGDKATIELIKKIGEPPRG
ncbi:hypothetical protein GF319_06070 [Candidatus Bathyarchaeota archaeon]|nr:hypothetical protein [Candidatus Bathyarchaeota archaeon]